MTECLPVKVKAAHVCAGSGGKAAFVLVDPVLKHIVGKVIRLHMTMHVSCCVRGSRIRYILLLEVFLSHSSWYLSQVGSDTELLRRLGTFGLGEVHIQSFFGKILQRVESHGEWLIERREVEC